ncbi:MAG: helix-turn-helix domain-containing protein [Bacteroidota bacterium]
MGCQVCLEDGFYAAIILMASLHGLLLATILFFSKRLKSKANAFLALVLLKMSIVLGFEFSYYFEYGAFLPLYLHYLPYYITSIIPVGIYYFTLFLIQPDLALNSFEKLGFVAICLEVVVDLMYLPLHLLIQDQPFVEMGENYIDTICQIIGLLSSLIFLPWALQRVSQYQRFLYANYSTANDKSLKWLRNFLGWLLGLVVLWFLSFIQQLLGFFDASEFTFEVLTLGLVMSLFWVGYFVILQSNWFQAVPFTPEKGDKTSMPTKLSANTERYHESLLALMEEEKLYKDIDLTLNSLSERLQISSGYVSQIINEKEQKNFFEFVNTYRVEAVKSKLLDPAFNNYTIMGIALESGFKSKSTFNAVFKKFTGQTPSGYKRSQLKTKVPTH